jgi:hypothetical protein
MTNQDSAPPAEQGDEVDIIAQVEAKIDSTDPEQDVELPIKDSIVKLGALYARIVKDEDPDQVINEDCIGACVDEACLHIAMTYLFAVTRDLKGRRAVRDLSSLFRAFLVDGIGLREKGSELMLKKYHSILNKFIPEDIEHVPVSAVESQAVMGIALNEASASESG